MCVTNIPMPAMVLRECIGAYVYKKLTVSPVPFVLCDVGPQLGRVYRCVCLCRGICVLPPSPCPLWC